MAVTYASFHTGLDARLAALEASTPIGFTSRQPKYDQPHSTWQWDPRINIFHRKWSAQAGNVGLTCTFKEECWADPWNLRKISYHDNAWPTPGLANAVAISKRHVIVSEHGGGLLDGNRWLIWAGYDQDGVLDDDLYEEPVDTYEGWVVGTIKNIRLDRIIDQPDSSAVSSYRVGYMKMDLPDGVVCKMLNPSTVNFSMSGLPLLIVNANRQALICTSGFHPGGHQNVHYHPTPIPSGAWSNTDLYRPGLFNPTQAAIVGSAVHLRDRFFNPLLGGHSGSPIFLCHGTDELVYFGHATTGHSATNPAVPASFPNLMAQQGLTRLHDRVIEACRILNNRYASANGGDPTLLPTYVS